MNKKLIDLQHITKSFDGQMILDDLNLYIRENEFLTLLGPSGCGKTTTLRILGGFETPDRGHVIFDDQDITKLPPNKRQLNTVFQKYALFTHMTIAENIAFGLKIKNKSKSYINDKIAYALKLVNLEGYGNRMPDSLSGGQQQRNNLSLACKRNVFDLQNVAPPRFKTDNRRYHRRQPHGFAVPADAVGTKAVNQHQRGQTFDAPAAFYHAAAVSADLIFGFAGEIGRRRISAQHLSVGIKNFFAGTDGVIIDFKPHFRPHFSFADKRFQHADDAAGKISLFGAADGFAAVFRGCCRHLRPAERQQHRHHRQPGGKTDGCRQQPLPERAVCFRTLQFFHLIFQFSSLFKQNSLFRPIVKSKFFRYSQT